MAVTARRRARELVVQGLYQWQLARADRPAIERQLSETSGFERADREFFSLLLRGCLEGWEELESSIVPLLDRPADRLSPIERGILVMAAYELANQPETPLRVILNEAVELAKRYGGTDGHKYVNGVLDKLASRLRAAESARRTADG